MKSRKKPFFDGRSEPNTFIGAVGASISTATLLAAKLSIQRYHIKNFQIDANNNISCYIGRNYTMNGQAWYNNNTITYYLDLAGKCTVLNNQAFHNTTNGSPQQDVVFPNLTGLTGTRVFAGGGAGTRNKMGIICAPKLEPIGTAGTTSDNHFSWCDYFRNVYVESGNTVNNLGGVDADISSAISSNIGTWINYSDNYDAPAKVTGIQVTAITETSIDVIWDDMTHVNTIDYYLVLANGNIVGRPNTTFFQITGLVKDTAYEIKILAIDSMGNNSPKFGVIQVTTDLYPNTFIGGVGNTAISTETDISNYSTALSASDIKKLSIDGSNNVSFYVEKAWTVTSGDWLYNNSNLTYFIDADGWFRGYAGLSVGCIAGTNLKYIHAPNFNTTQGGRRIASINDSLVRANLPFPVALGGDETGNHIFDNHTKIKRVYNLGNQLLSTNNAFYGYYNMTGLERAYFGNVTTIGSFINNNIRSGFATTMMNCKIGAKVYHNPALNNIDQKAFAAFTKTVTFGDEIIINGLTYTCINGTPTVDGEYDGNGINNGVKLSNLVTAINSDTRTGTTATGVSAYRTSYVVVEANVAGTGDTITIQDGTGTTYTYLYGSSGSPLVNGHGYHHWLYCLQQKRSVNLIEVSAITVNAPTSLSYTNLTSSSVDLTFTEPTPNANGTDVYELWVDDGTLWRDKFWYQEISGSTATVDLTDVVTDVGSVSGIKMKVRTMDNHMNFSDFSNEITLP